MPLFEARGLVSSHAVLCSLHYDRYQDAPQVGSDGTQLHHIVE